MKEKISRVGHTICQECGAKAFNEQCELQELIVKRANINVVTCGNCGDVFFHKIHRKNLKYTETSHNLTCPHCFLTSDPCDMPDFYVGEFYV